MVGAGEEPTGVRMTWAQTPGYSWRRPVKSRFVYAIRHSIIEARDYRRPSSELQSGGAP